jgi:hypothetical protein
MRPSTRQPVIISAMATALFPHKREDGSFAVAARFAVSGTNTAESIRQRAAAWVSTRTADGPASLLADFSSLPEVQQASPDTLDVVFDDRPGSRRWKDWMVALTQELTSVDGAAFVGFWDLVTGRPHPASTHPQDGPPSPDECPGTLMARGAAKSL